MIQIEIDKLLVIAKKSEYSAEAMHVVILFVCDEHVGEYRLVVGMGADGFVNDDHVGSVVV